MIRPTSFRHHLAARAFAALALLIAAPLSAKSPSPAPVTIGIAAINDFHGALEPPNQAVPFTRDDGQIELVPAGGVAWLASAVDSIRARYANTLTVSAGDLVGGSQLVSSLFLDEPAITAMNRIGLEFNAVGNHEFDAGIDELLRKQKGGCAQFTMRKPCQIEPFAGAKFRFLAANSVRPDGSTLFATTAIKRFGKGRGRVSVGLIGVTLKGTDGLVSPENLGGTRFTDEAATINALVPRLKAQGADAIVVLIHQGGRTGGKPNPSGCTDFNAGILPILDQLDTRVDVVISGHTHWAYICDYGAINPAKPFLVTSAGVFGELVTDISLTIDPATHKVSAKKARQVIVQSPGYRNVRGDILPVDMVPRFEPRADIAALVARYHDSAKAFTQRPVGKLAGPAERPGGEASRTGGSLGNLIADAQLAASAGAGAEIAFMNPFGIRAPSQLIPAADGSLTFGQLYTVQPFNNTLLTQSMTGAEIKLVLEQGLDENAPYQLLSPSRGFTYAFDVARPLGDRIVDIRFNGAPLDPKRMYRVTTNSFLANGGDSYTQFAQQRDPVVGMPDIEALEAWLKAVPPRSVPEEERVKDLNPAATPPRPGTINSFGPNNPTPPAGARE